MHRKLLALLAAVVALSTCTTARADDLQRVIQSAQTKVVKIFGAGGLRQMEAYQTGILISPDGHVLTALSYVLDTDDLAVILHDGRKFQAEFVGSDPFTELALLKLPVEGEQLLHFQLEQRSAALALPGQRILALSNLYGIATGDEAVSVLQGVITAIAPLKARRGAYQANYRGDVYVLDAYANNPGAAGGALVDGQGKLLGVLGKELRSEVTGTWLNYALPVKGIASTIDDLLSGRVDTTQLELAEPEDALTMEKLGFSLVPDVLPRTPPYIDALRRESPAQRAGLQTDDLVVFVAGEPIDSHRSVVQRLGKIESFEPVAISVLRDGQLREFSLVLPAIVEDKPTDDSNETDSDGQEP
ncbi:MAG: S1C family serine protease [Bythopirellula sp.]